MIYETALTRKTTQTKLYVMFKKSAIQYINAYESKPTI